MLIVDRNREGLGYDLPDRKLLRQRVVDGEGPIDGAEIAGVGVVLVRRQRQRAERSRCRIEPRQRSGDRACRQRRCEQMTVGQINILERDGSGRALGAVFNNRAAGQSYSGCRRNGRRIIGARNGESERLRGGR